MKIIGITGTCGAGKGTVVDYLIGKQNFKHLSVSGYLTEEIEKRGLQVNRDSMREVANDLRTKFGPSYIVEELYKIAEKSGCDTIIESIRCPGEVHGLKKFSEFVLICVDCDRKIRYDRCVLRASSKDNVTYEEFIEQEEKEMGNTDPAKQNIALCMEYCDYELDNEGDFGDLFSQIDKVLQDIDKLIETR